MMFGWGLHKDFMGFHDGFHGKSWDFLWEIMGFSLEFSLEFAWKLDEIFSAIMELSYEDFMGLHVYMLILICKWVCLNIG